MTNRINQVMNLENNEKYIVMKQAVYKNESYYLTAKLTDNEEDVLEEFKLLKEINNDGNESVIEVTDKKVFELVTKYFGISDN